MIPISTPEVQQCMAGKRWDNTKSEINDRLTILKGKPAWKISKIYIWADPKRYVNGLQFFYKVPGLQDELSSGAHIGTKHGTQTNDVFYLDDDEFITEFSGRAGDVMDNVIFKTNKGKISSYGSQKTGAPFNFCAPPGNCFNLFIFATNGHIHYMKTTPEPIPTFRGALPSFPAFSTAPPRKSTVAGGVNPDTRAFDDYNSVLSTLPSPPEIQAVTVYYDSQYIFGLEVTYRTARGVLSGGRHIGSDSNSQPVQQATISLDYGEQITEISGRAGNIVDHIRIVTSNGKIIDVGGTGGNPFFNLVPMGSRVVGIGGGTNGHLHNLYAYLV